ncbi:PqiC family protein [Gayadomonas joobiniege]|uniref:PqiC family protein n=1 Tax=Gayadomonas joobiniege TaxID=1234606 RepID=UPI000360E1B7|nr:PqiC family protein [Gayadomonas joobiniege]
MKLTKVFILSISLFLAACASKQEISYYMLPLSKQSVPGRYLDVTVKLPDYLQQDSLVVVGQNNQVHFAHFHRWAEPLQKAISFQVGYELAQAIKLKNCQTECGTSVTIEIIRFHGSESGNIVFKGLWSINGEKVKAFNFNRLQDSPGYGSLVVGMDKLISQLVAEIAVDWPQANAL